MTTEQQIPDAPWIREAEMYGVPESDGSVCPVCGAWNPDRFSVTHDTDEVLGCSDCVDSVDPYEFLADHREEGGPD